MDDSMTSHVILPYTVMGEELAPEPLAANLEDEFLVPEEYVQEDNQEATTHMQQELPEEYRQDANQEDLTDMQQQPEEYRQYENQEDLTHMQQEQEQPQQVAAEAVDKDEAIYERQQNAVDPLIMEPTPTPTPAPAPKLRYQHDPALAEISAKWVHTKERVPCDICHKSFVNRSKMLWHKRTHDKNRTRFQCPYNDCGRLYASKQACDLHYRQAHLESGLICPVCQKVFVIRQTLEVHMRYHTGTYPFECEYCEKKFAQKGHLTTHMQVKHNNLRYICQEPGCGKVFKNSMSLRNHSFVHVGMPFKCAFCDKGYPQKSKLKVHISLKHNRELSLDELESMRKFKDPRIRHSFVRLEEEEGIELAESIIEFDDDASREVEVAL